MEAEDARKILQSLAQGFDPATGESVVAHELLRRSEVREALAAAVVALEQEVVRERRRAALPANAGTRWTPETDRAIVEAYRAGASPAAIAADTGRTLRAIEARLEHHGVLSPSQRSTRDRFRPPWRTDSS